MSAGGNDAVAGSRGASAAGNVERACSAVPGVEIGDSARWAIVGARGDAAAGASPDGRLYSDGPRS
jgi:hypothetical protein